MEQERVKKKANDKWLFIIMFLVLILFAYYESRNKEINIYSYSREIKILPGNTNIF